MGAAPLLHFVVPVWGESYVKTFLDYCLPAQLSPENIPFLGKNGNHGYTIYSPGHLETRPLRSLLGRVSRPDCR